MANDRLQHCDFVAYSIDNKDNRLVARSDAPDFAKAYRGGGWRRIAFDLALRDCGVSVYELMTRKHAHGSQDYSFNYMASAEFACSAHSANGYGCTSRAETLRDHIAAVRAAAGDDAAEHARQSMPNHVTDDSQILVLHVWAQGGRALGTGRIVDNLPDSAEAANARREALTAAPKRSSRKRKSRAKSETPSDGTQS